MNSTLCDRVNLDVSSFVQDQFATTPVIAVHPALAYQQPNEEELHTSFEQAISDRVVAINKQLSRISGPLINSQAMRSVKRQNNFLNSTFLSQAQRQCILYLSLAIMFLLVGFDLMGLLMLYKH